MLDQEPERLDEALGQALDRGPPVDVFAVPPVHAQPAPGDEASQFGGERLFWRQKRSWSPSSSIRTPRPRRWARNSRVVMPSHTSR